MHRPAGRPGWKIRTRTGGASSLATSGVPAIALPKPMGVSEVADPPVIFFSVL